MKKHSLLKVLGIILFLVVVLTWIIPLGTYSSGEFTKGVTAPLGIFDILKLPLSSFAYFIQFSLLFLLIGGLYGVINKTGVYGDLVSSIVKKFKKKENVFLIITAILFTVLSSVTGLNLTLLIIVPFFITVLLSMDYNKKVAFLATIGAILVGNIASTYGFNFNGYINYYFSLEINSDIIAKFVFLALITYLLVIFLLKTSKKTVVKTTKKEDKKITVEENNIPLFSKTGKSKKSYVPLIITMILGLVLLLVGMYSWKYSLDVTFFEEIHTNLSNVKIGEYAILKNILGNINPLGYWSIYEMEIIIVILTIIIAWLYSIKFSDVVDSFIAGAKEMLKPAIYVALANVVFHIIVITQPNGNIFNTISNSIFGLTKGFNTITMMIFSLLGGIFYNDFTYLIGMMGTNISAIYSDVTLYPVIGMIIRSFFGIVMLILPTSILLIGGLSYLDISFKEWIKYIWKYILQILVIVVLIITVSLILL